MTTTAKARTCTTAQGGSIPGKADNSPVKVYGRESHTQTHVTEVCGGEAPQVLEGVAVGARVPVEGGRGVVDDGDVLHLEADVVSDPVTIEVRGSEHSVRSDDDGEHEVDCLSRAAVPHLVEEQVVRHQVQRAAHRLQETAVFGRVSSGLTGGASCPPCEVLIGGASFP